MTDTYPAASSPSASPVPPAPAEPRPAPRPDEEETRAATAPNAQNAAPEQRSIDDEMARLQGRPDAPENASPANEGDRHVWTPPVPQFPARPSQAPPVQYAGPQPAPVPNYVPPQPPQQPAPPQAGSPPQASQPQSQSQYQYGQPQQYMHPHSQSAPMPSYAPAMPQQVNAPTPAPPRTSRARVGRRFMRRVVSGGSGIGKLIGGARLPITLLFLILAGVITYLAVDRANLASALSVKPNAVAPGTIVLPPESRTVTTYINGFKNNDLEGVWNALSPAEKAGRIDSGEDKTVMKAVLNFVGQNNVSATYRFVGAYGTVSPTDFSKGGIYYYAMNLSTGQQSETVPLVFVVDEQGQVDQVVDPLYRTVLREVAKG